VRSSIFCPSFSRATRKAPPPKLMLGCGSLRGVPSELMSPVRSHAIFRTTLRHFLHDMAAWGSCHHTKSSSPFFDNCSRRISPFFPYSHDWGKGGSKMMWEVRAPRHRRPFFEALQYPMMIPLSWPQTISLKPLCPFLSMNPIQFKALGLWSRKIHLRRARSVCGKRRQACEAATVDGRALTMYV
jgi:hypothetical protein